MATCTDVTKAFADRLSEMIDSEKKEGKTIRDIAEESGVPSGSISKYQNDAGEAGINSLVKLASYFDVSTDFLLGLSEIASGNADDMAIEKRLGLRITTIENLSQFHAKDGSRFLNRLFERGFGEIVLGCQTSLDNYIEAAQEESLSFSGDPIGKLRYGIKLSNYDPVRTEDGLGFTLTLSADKYYRFCVQQVCAQLEGFLLDLADDVLRRIEELKGEYFDNVWKKEKHHPQGWIDSSSGLSRS